jgi:hypothetical protein
MGIHKSFVSVTAHVLCMHYTERLDHVLGRCRSFIRNDISSCPHPQVPYNTEAMYSWTVLCISIGGPLGTHASGPSTLHVRIANRLVINA